MSGLLVKIGGIKACIAKIMFCFAFISGFIGPLTMFFRPDLPIEATKENEMVQGSCAHMVLHLC
jgi:hypothetical protein